MSHFHWQLGDGYPALAVRLGVLAIVAWIKSPQEGAFLLRSGPNIMDELDELVKKRHFYGLVWNSSIFFSDASEEQFQQTLKNLGVYPDVRRHLTENRMPGEIVVFGGLLLKDAVASTRGSLAGMFNTNPVRSNGSSARVSDQAFNVLRMHGPGVPWGDYYKAWTSAGIAAGLPVVLWADA